MRIRWVQTMFAQLTPGLYPHCQGPVYAAVWSCILLKVTMDRIFLVPLSKHRGLRLLQGPRGLPGFCRGVKYPSVKELTCSCLSNASLTSSAGPRNPLRTSSWCGLVGTNGRCARLRTSTEDGTCHLETTVLRLRKTNLLTDQDLSFSAPSFRFLSYLHSTSSAKAGQNKSPSVGVRLINEQRTRTTQSLRKSFISSHCSLQALYI